MNKLDLQIARAAEYESDEGDAEDESDEEDIQDKSDEGDTEDKSDEEKSRIDNYDDSDEEEAEDEKQEEDRATGLQDSSSDSEGEHRSINSLNSTEFRAAMTQHSQIQHFGTKTDFLTSHAIDIILTTIEETPRISKLSLTFDKLETKNKENLKTIISVNTYKWNRKPPSEINYTVIVSSETLDEENIGTVQSVIRENIHLTSISIQQTYASLNEMRKMMRRIMSIDHISELDIDCKVYIFDMLKEDVKFNPHLRSLYLGHVNILAINDWQRLSSYLRDNKVISTLWVENNNISEQLLALMINDLKAITSLTSLSIHGNNLKKNSCLALVSLINSNSALSTLKLKHNHIREPDFETLCAALASSTSLRELSLVDNIFNDLASNSFANIVLRNTSLRDLNLSENHLHRSSIMDLSKALTRNTSLKSLKLSGNKLRGECMMVLCESLKHNTKLRRLSITNCKVEPFGFTLLAEYISVTTTLKELNITANTLHSHQKILLEKAICTNRSLSRGSVSSLLPSYRAGKRVREAMKRNLTLYNQTKLMRHRVRTLLSLQIILFPRSMKDHKNLIGKVPHDILKTIFIKMVDNGYLNSIQELFKIFDYAKNRFNLSKKKREDFENIFIRDEIVPKRIPTPRKKRSFEEIEDYE